MTEFQVIATTATLRDPSEHLRRLTGMNFVDVGEEMNGAPSHGTSIRHIDGPEFGAPAECAAIESARAIMERKPSASGLIVYMDSRQGVERVVQGIGSPNFLPYRQGYVAEDRRAIEQALRDGRADGVGTTSALEAGIHLPQFSFGLTVNVPPSRKSLRQRTGRIGRTGPGVFLIQAPRTAFSKLGITLRDSFESKVEGSPLYLENRFIQFQQACCYLREAELDGDEPLLDPDLDWPPEFMRFVKYASPTSRRPDDLEDLARLGAENPHRAFGLRAMPSLTFALKDVRLRETIGTIEQPKALREAAPGMTYIHKGRAYRVLGWRTSIYDASIELLPVRHAPRTYPILRSQIGVAKDEDSIIDGHHIASPDGSLFEAKLRIVESVEGYRIGDTSCLYRDLRQTNQRMTRKQREYTTTGVVLQIGQDWIAGSTDQQIATRRQLASACKAVLVHAYGISPSDIECAHTGIAIHTAAGSRKLDDALALYDTISGGLRLTAPLFKSFSNVIDQLRRGVELAGGEALVSASVLNRVEEWFEALRPDRQPTATKIPEDDRHLVYAPGSKVLVTVRGQATEYEIGEPQLIVLGDVEQLMYSFDAGGGARGWVSAEHVGPSGNGWRRALWDSSTNQLEILELPS